MTALENVALPLELAGASGAFDTARALLDDVGLAERVDHFPAELSGGEQQRVAIARALSRRPRLILADEPTGNLDGKTGRQIVELLFGMKEKLSATLVLVTHDERLARMTERLIRMGDGRIATDARPAADGAGRGTMTFALDIPAGKADRTGGRAAILRIGARELRGGLSGFRIFIACLALGVMVIAAVGALGDALTSRVRTPGPNDPWRRHDVCAHARAGNAPNEITALFARATVSETATMRTMARRPDGS